LPFRTIGQQAYHHLIVVSGGSAAFFRNEHILSIVRIVRTDKSKRSALHKSADQRLCAPFEYFYDDALPAFSPSVTVSGHLYPDDVLVEGAIDIRSGDKDILVFSLHAHKTKTARMSGKDAGQML